VGLSAVLLFGWTGVAHAQRRDSQCESRIQRDRADVEEAVNRYGYDSPQARHERSELQRAAQDCGYDGDAYRDGWAHRGDDRWRDQDGYPDRWDSRGYSYNGQNGDQYGRPYGDASPAYDIGYRDGLAIGQKDSQKHKSFRPQKNDRFEDADHGYNRSYGDKNTYKNLYRDGYQRGYSEGYRQGQYRD